MEPKNGEGHQLFETPAQSLASPECGVEQISVIIPAYRCAQYIAQAVQSVLKQTFPPYEIIVINDGSPDTPSLEAALAPYRNKIQFVRQSTTSGPSERFCRRYSR